MLKFHTDRKYGYEDGKTIVKENYLNSMVFIKGNRRYDIADIKFYDKTGIKHHSYAYSWFCRVNHNGGYEGRDTNNKFEAIQFDNELILKRSLDFTVQEAFLYKDEESKEKTYLHSNPVTLYVNIKALNNYRIETYISKKLNYKYQYDKQVDLLTDEFRNIVDFTHVNPENRMELVKNDLLKRIENVINNNSEEVTIEYMLNLLDVDKYKIINIGGN